MTVSQDPYSGDQSSHASSVPTKAEASQVATASHSVQETLRPQSGRMRPGTGTARASARSTWPRIPNCSGRWR
jgi:hypothetical protein